MHGHLSGVPRQICLEQIWTAAGDPKGEGQDGLSQRGRTVGAGVVAKIIE